MCGRRLPRWQWTSEDVLADEPGNSTTPLLFPSDRAFASSGKDSEGTDEVGRVSGV